MADAIWVAVVIAGAAAGTAVYVTGEQKKAASSAQKKAEAARRRQMEYETEAGEHWEEINLQQMEMQSQQHQITLLADLIKQKEEPEPQILTLPPAKTYGALDRINQAIDDLVRGRT